MYSINAFYKHILIIRAIMKSTKISSKEKASFYINKDLVKRMKPFLVKTKKTDFINESIEEKIEKLEKEKSKKEVLNFLHSIKPIKIKKPALDIIHEAREERMQKVIGKNCKRVK